MHLDYSTLLRRTSALLCLLTSFIAFQSHALTAPEQATSGPSIEGVTEYRLSNGLRILLAPDASKPTTTVNMTYLVGSRFENYGQTGMAHLLEHMLFKGTPTTRNAMGEFSRRGLQANGSTSQDRTNFFASFAANPETLKWYLGWQADAMANSLIAREDLDSEMTVVRNEMDRGENNPFRMLMQKMTAAAYEWHNYGKSTIGARSDVENVDVAQLKAFYHEYYQPDNAVLIVSGKFDTQSTLGDIVASFGKLPKPTRILPAQYTVEPVQDGERSVTLRRTGGSPLVAAMYHIPAGGSPGAVAFDLAASILQDTPSGRLYHALVAKRLAASVFGFAMGQREPGTALFGAELEPGMDQSAALNTLTKTLESVRVEPFTQEELERARSKWITGWQRVYSDPEELGVALSEAIANGDWRLFFLSRDRARDATLAQVQAVANDYLRASNRTEGRYVPTEKPDRTPAQSPLDLQGALKDYKGDQDANKVEAFNASPENIDMLTQRDTLDLPNGPVRLALLPKPTRGDRVYAQLRLQSGDEQSLRGLPDVAETAYVLLDRGTDTLSRQQIQDRLTALQADVSFGGSTGQLAVGMTTTKENLPALMRLVLQIIEHASYPQAEIDEYRRQMVTYIHSAMTEPQAIAVRTLSRHQHPWPADDVRYVPTFEESLKNIEAIKRDALVAFHKRFIGAGSIYFSAVGAFDPQQVRATLKEELASWPRAAAYQRVTDPFRDVAVRRFHIETPDKANAFMIAQMPVKLQDTDPDYPALVMANFLLGGSQTSRLWDRIREQDGLSYSIGSTLEASSFEPNGSWTTYAIYAPKDRKRVENGISEEIARVAKSGFTDAEIHSGISAILNYRALARAQDQALASAWIDYRIKDRTFAWSAEIDRKLAALTPAKVNTAIAKYLRPKDFSKALAGDFSASAPATSAASPAPESPEPPTLK